MEIQTAKIKGLVSYFKQFLTKRTDAKLNCFNYDISLRHLELYTGGNEVPFNEISLAWLEGLKDYFVRAKGLRCEKPLSINSANSYFSIIISVTREAADEGFVNHQIVSSVKNIQSRTQAKSTALSFEDLQQLVNADCKPFALKKAFLFSCLTGIQWRDIETLKWDQVIATEDDTWEVLLYRGTEEARIPLSTQARELLGIGGHPNKRIFYTHYSAALCVSLNKWALRAGIMRKITFHSARQTFGKMLLDQGIEIELISKLLGHKQLKTTTKFLSIETGKPSVTSNYFRTFNI